MEIPRGRGKAKVFNEEYGEKLEFSGGVWGWWGVGTKQKTFRGMDIFWNHTLLSESFSYFVRYILNATA